MNICGTLLTLCLIFAPQPAEAKHVGEECFASEHQIRMVHKTEHIYHHKTPNGVCWHVGKKNHSETFTSTKRSQLKAGHTTSWGSNAKPGSLYLGAIPIPWFSVDEGQHEWGKSWLRVGH